MAEVLTAEGDELSYTYDVSDVSDVSDGWRHRIVVDKVVTGAFVDKGAAVCLAGARAAPPEDCGGIVGYERFCEVVANPEHPDHADLVDRFGFVDHLDFDPERFAPDELNRLLAAVPFTARPPVP